jgi:S1-C subfamily serine protease/cytochrome c-type biogenesis protein CcmH/NrfG
MIARRHTYKLMQALVCALLASMFNIAMVGMAAGAPSPGTTTKQLEVADVLAKARPAVVTVIATKEAGGSQGSGVIVAADGVVLTAWHVVAGAKSVVVRLSTGEEIPVQGLQGGGEESDFALLKVARTGLPVVPMGDSDKVRQGDRVLTLGAPLGMEASASEGIVSAVRDLPGGKRLIQTTAPISPGSSGGPVLNMRGEVIGIASFLLVEGQNLNFAVPINEAKLSIKASARAASLAGLAVATKPDDALLLYWAGRAAMPAAEDTPAADGQWKKALALLEKAVARRKDFVDAWLQVAKCDELLNRQQQRIAALQEVVRLAPGWTEGYTLLADAYARLGRLQDTVASFRAAMRLGRDPRIAFDAMARQREVLAEAVRLEPDDADARFCLGVACRQQEHYQEAVDTLKEAIRLRPGDPEFRFELGLCYDYLKLYQDAQNSLREALRLRPEHTEARRFLISVLKDMPHPEEDAARDAWMRALNESRDSDEAWKRYDALQSRRQEDVLSLCREAVRARPDDADAHDDLGDAYGECSRWQEAVDAYQQAIRLRPDDASLYRSLAHAYMELGDINRLYSSGGDADGYRRAVDALKQAVLLRPYDLSAHSLLGRSYLKVGDRQGALDEYKALRDLESADQSDIEHKICLRHLEEFRHLNPYNSLEDRAELLREIRDETLEYSLPMIIQRAVEKVTAGGKKSSPDADALFKLIYP